jgi:hypothetical protein
VRRVRGSLVAAVGLAVAACLLVPPAAHAADASDILLDDAGPGFQRGPDQQGSLGSTTRTFVHPHGQLQLQAIPVTGGVSTRQLFALLEQVDVGIPGVATVDVPGLPLARWMGEEGVPPERSSVLFVAFAARSAVFSALLTTDDVRALPPVATLLDVATRQIARAGGPPEGADRPAAAADPTLTELLPGDPDPRFGLTGSVTGGGPDQLPAGLGISPEVVSFLNRRSRTVVRAWTDPTTGLAAAISLTSYPYEVFAGAALAATADDGEVALQSSSANADVADVLTFTGRGDKAGEVGAALRRGRISAVILVQPGRGGQAEAEAVVSDLVHQLGQRLPARASSLYRFPPPPSTIAGLALTAVIVTAAAAACIGVGRARAWTLRRADAPGPVALAAPGVGSVATGTWTGSGSPAGLAPPPPSGGATAPAPQVAPDSAAGAPALDSAAGAPALDSAAGAPAPGSAVPVGEQVTDLDGDARALRRRGLVVVVVQLVALNVIVIALAGDFAWPGVAVAVIGLAGGLGFTSWWRRRELGAIGPQGAGAPFILPRPAGALVGIISLAVLGIGIAYTFKGLRYLVLKPTLAQLRWSDLLGLSPRGVGLAFTIGGFLVAVLGGALFRLARALGRADTRRLLAVDRRPPVLYLRSFDDDTVPLATIASARRPFFELLSFRGRDPFEEAVAWELATYGPVVAVGRPGRSLASLGAAREHLSDDTWKTQVAARMHDARAIALAAGETPGLHWEVAQVVAAGHLGKTVFILPPLPAEALARRWTFTASALESAGAVVDRLPADVGLVHTVQVGAEGRVAVTTAHGRDEASYRTAVDRAMALVPPLVASGAPGTLGAPDAPDVPDAPEVAPSPTVGAPLAAAVGAPSGPLAGPPSPSPPAPPPAPPSAPTAPPSAPPPGPSAAAPASAPPTAPTEPTLPSAAPMPPAVSPG